MSDKKYLEICLNEIEKKLNRGSRKEWTDPDFIELRNNIYERSEISISTHTLKRLFGKIKYKNFYNPQHATRVAIAKYLGFESWEDFKKANQSESDYNTNHFELNRLVKNIINFFYRFKKATRLIILVFLIASTTYIISRLMLSNSPDFEFSVENPIGLVPHTVTFNYDVSRFYPGSTAINSGSTHPFLDRQNHIVDRSSGQVFYTYQIPGIYRPKLKHKNVFLDSLLVIVMSNGWTGFFQDDKNNYNLYWLSNNINEVVDDNHLTLPRKIINKFGFDTTGLYSTAFRNIKDFGLSGDNFTFSTRFSNGLESGGITCFDVNFIFYFKNTTSHIRLVEEDCQSWCRIKYSDLFLDGHTTDLRFLSGKFNNWTHFELHVVNKNIVIKIENKEVFQGTYNESCGELFGLEFRFKGSGMIDFVSLHNTADQELYFNDFSNKSSD